MDKFKTLPNLSRSKTVSHSSAKEASASQQQQQQQQQASSPSSALVRKLQQQLEQREEQLQTAGEMGSQAVAEIMSLRANIRELQLQIATAASPTKAGKKGRVAAAMSPGSPQRRSKAKARNARRLSVNFSAPPVMSNAHAAAAATTATTTTLLLDDGDSSSALDDEDEERRGATQNDEEDGVYESTEATEHLLREDDSPASEGEDGTPGGSSSESSADAGRLSRKLRLSRERAAEFERAAKTAERAAAELRATVAAMERDRAADKTHQEVLWRTECELQAARDGGAELLQRLQRLQGEHRQLEARAKASAEAGELLRAQLDAEGARRAALEEAAALAAGELAEARGERAEYKQRWEELQDQAEASLLGSRGTAGARSGDSLDGGSFAETDEEKRRKFVHLDALLERIDRLEAENARVAEEKAELEALLAQYEDAGGAGHGGKAQSPGPHFLQSLGDELRMTRREIATETEARLATQAGAATETEARLATQRSVATETRGDLAGLACAAVQATALANALCASAGAQTEAPAPGDSVAVQATPPAGSEQETLTELWGPVVARPSPSLRQICGAGLWLYKYPTSKAFGRRPDGGGGGGSTPHFRAEHLRFVLFNSDARTLTWSRSRVQQSEEEAAAAASENRHLKKRALVRETKSVRVGNFSVQTSAAARDEGMRLVLVECALDGRKVVPLRARNAREEAILIEGLSEMFSRAET